MSTVADAHQPSSCRDDTLAITWPAWFLVLSAMAAAVIFLWWNPLTQMTLPVVTLAAAAMAWLNYQFHAPLRLARRHAILSHLTSDISPLRRWFWNSLIQTSAQVLRAIVLALAVLIVSDGLREPEWWIILAGILLFPPAYSLACALSVRHVSAQYRFIYAARIAQYFVLAPVLVAIVVVNLFWLDVADTRHIQWIPLLLESFRGANDAAVLPATGWLLGIGAALESGSWHLMQLMTGVSEAGFTVKAVAWLVFLLWQAVKVGLLLAVLTGLMMQIRQWNLPAERGGGQPSSMPAFVMLLLLGGALLWAALISQVQPSGWLQQRLQPGLVRWSDPCYDQRQSQQRALERAADAQLTHGHTVLLAQLEEQIDGHLAVAFAGAEQAIDSYLDWNFSLTGQYAQLAWMLNAAVSDTDYADHVRGRMDGYLRPVLEPALFQATQSLQGVYQQQSAAWISRHAVWMEEQGAAADCLQLPMPQMGLQDYTHKSLVGLGAGAGIATARVGARIGTRVAGKAATRRMAAGVTGRMSARVATGSGAAANGVLCGPLVVVCAPALAAGAWLLTDLAINEIDEAINRERLRSDLLAALEEEKAQLRQELYRHYDRAIDLLASDIERYQAMRFNIVRDGIMPQHFAANGPH